LFCCSSEKKLKKILKIKKKKAQQEHSESFILKNAHTVQKNPQQQRVRNEKAVYKSQKPTQKNFV
jgi:hypothetical protein